MKRLITTTLPILLSLLFLQGLMVSGFSQQEKATGKWSMEKDGSGFKFEIEYIRSDGKSTQSEKFNTSDFTGFKIGNQVSFSVVRPAGTMVFKGDVKANEGQGTFVFTPDNGFAKAITDNGFEAMKIEGMMLALFQNTPKSYFADLKKLGYSGLPNARLLAFIALEITPDYISGIHKAGYPDLPAGNIVTFKAMKITTEYIRDMREWVGKDLTANELVQYSAMKIDKDYAKEMAQSGLDITPNQLVQYKALKIDPSYIADMRAVGFKDLNSNQITQLKGMDITPEYVAKIRELGFTEASSNEILQFKAMGITEAFVKDLKQAGYTDLSISQLAQCKALNIDRELIKKATDFYDGKRPEFRKLVTFAALRHSPGH